MIFNRELIKSLIAFHGPRWPLIADQMVNLKSLTSKTLEHLCHTSSTIATMTGKIKGTLTQNLKNLCLLIMDQGASNYKSNARFKILNLKNPRSPISHIVNKTEREINRTSTDIQGCESHIHIQMPWIRIFRHSHICRYFFGYLFRYLCYALFCAIVAC